MSLKIFTLFLLIPCSQAKEFLPTSFRMVYQQTIKKKISGKLQKTQGTIDYHYPGRIRFEQNKPEKIIWVSNRKKNWFYQAPFIEGEAGQLKITSGNENGLLKLFDGLRNGLVSNKNYQVKEMEHGTKITFKQNESVAQAILKFSGDKFFDNLKFVQVLQRDGRSIKISIEKIVRNINHPANHFTFTPPKNTRIIRQQ